MCLCSCAAAGEELKGLTWAFLSTAWTAHAWSSNTGLRGDRNIGAQRLVSCCCRASQGRQPKQTPLKRHLKSSVTHRKKHFNICTLTAVKGQATKQERTRKGEELLTCHSSGSVCLPRSLTDQRRREECSFSGLQSASLSNKTRKPPQRHSWISQPHQAPACHLEHFNCQRINEFNVGIIQCGGRISLPVKQDLQEWTDSP